MQGAARIIYEVIPSPGVNPESQIDTDEFDPVSYDDLVTNAEALYQIAANAVDTAIPIPNACLVLIVSDVAIQLRLNSGETPLRVRYFLIGSDASNEIAAAASDLLVSGLGELATVRVKALGSV